MGHLAMLTIFSCAVLSRGLEEGGSLNCGDHTPLAGLHSTFNGSSRVFSVVCLAPPDEAVFLAPSSSSSSSSSSLNTSACTDAAVVTGLSPDDTGGGGGRLGVICSPLSDGYSLVYCSLSRWLNGAGESFSMPGLPWPWLVRSVLSHSLMQESDWRYKLELCQLANVSSTTTESCPIPSIPHGTVHSIDHTHSITESHAPFRIKISLTCDPGYYRNQTHAVSECENGTWTQLPTCEGCSPIGYCDELVCTNSSDSLCLQCLPELPNGLPLVLSKSGRRCRAVPVISTGDLAVGFVAGSNLTLDCVVRGRPTPHMSWHRVLLVSGDRVPLLDHTHFITHENGSLTIVNISDMDSGPYVCRAWNAAGSDIVYIDVYNSHPDGTGPPAIYHWCPLHVVSHPHTLTPSHLHCDARGYPPPIITWSLLNITSHPHTLTPSHLPPDTFHPILSPTVSQHQNGTLEVNPVRTADTALYRCEASNLFGTVASETVFFVESHIDSERPVISELPASYSTPVGGQLEITCTTTVTPSSLATVLWMKKGGRVPITGTRVWQNGNGNLVFESVLVSDQGPYWCVVWNEGGVTMEMTELVIIDDVIENTPPLESDSITIQCSLFLITSLITGASLYMS